MRKSGRPKNRQFQKRSQLFICTHNKASGVPRAAATTQNRQHLLSVLEIQPQFHPALLRLSAMISQSFTRVDKSQQSEQSRIDWTALPSLLELLEITLVLFPI